MARFQPKRHPGNGPERKIQDDIKRLLRMHEWHVMETHGNIYQTGFPDLYATHAQYGPRWIEVKNLANYVFTPAQKVQFPKMCANGSGVWVLVAATTSEYNKLFKPFNWWHYLK